MNYHPPFPKIISSDNGDDGNSIGAINGYNKTNKNDLASSYELEEIIPKKMSNSTTTTKNSPGGDKNEDEYEDDNWFHLSEMTRKNQERCALVAKHYSGDIILYGAGPNHVKTILHSSKATTPIFLQALIVYFIVACDSLCLTIIQPFLPEMVRFKFTRLASNEIGYYVGLTLGAFSCARFFSSTYFGYYSDMYGRKTFLLISLFVNFIGTIVFGHVPIIELLILVRFLQGFLSSTNTLAKTVLVDIAKNHKISNDERSVLFAYLGSAFALSRSISSSLGGLSVGVAKSLGIQDPYQFACYCASALVLLAFVMALFLPETNQKVQPLVKPSLIELDPVEAPNKGFMRGLKAMISSSVTMKLLVNYGLTAFSNSCCFVIWVLCAQGKSSHYGLEFNSTEIGLFFGLYGACAFLFQLVCFKRVLDRMGIYKTYTYGCVIQMFQCSLLPIIMLTNYYVGSYYLLWSLLLAFSLVSGVGFMTQMPVAQSMIVNATDVELQGLVQGSSESLATLLRGFGPVLTGMAYSLCIHYFGNAFFLYVLLFLQYAITFLIFITLKPEDVTGKS